VHQGRLDPFLPIREHAFHGVLQALGARDLGARDEPVLALAAGQALVALVQRRRAGGEAAAPLVHLLVANPPAHLVLALALQCPVVALVQAPAPCHRQPHPVHLVEHDPERSDRPLQHRGEAAVESRTLAAQQPGRLPRLLRTGVRQVDIRPAREQIVAVPDALAVTKQN
jgi:hypothetical protein